MAPRKKPEGPSKKDWQKLSKAKRDAEAVANARKSAQAARRSAGRPSAASTPGKPVVGTVRNSPEWTRGGGVPRPSGKPIRPTASPARPPVLNQPKQGGLAGKSAQGLAAALLVAGNYYSSRVERKERRAGKGATADFRQGSRTVMPDTPGYLDFMDHRGIVGAAADQYKEIKALLSGYLEARERGASVGAALAETGFENRIRPILESGVSKAILSWKGMMDEQEGRGPGRTASDVVDNWSASMFPTRRTALPDGWSDVGSPGTLEGLMDNYSAPAAPRSAVPEGYSSREAQAEAWLEEQESLDELSRRHEASRSPLDVSARADDLIREDLAKEPRRVFTGPGGREVWLDQRPGYLERPATRVRTVPEGSVTAHFKSTAAANPRALPTGAEAYRGRQVLRNVRDPETGVVTQTPIDMDPVQAAQSIWDSNVRRHKEARYQNDLRGGGALQAAGYSGRGATMNARDYYDSVMSGRRPRSV